MTSLNCRTLANPAAKAISVSGSVVWSMSSRRSLRPTAARQPKGAGADLGDEHPVQLALADVQGRGQPGDPVLVYVPRADEP